MDGGISSCYVVGVLWKHENWKGLTSRNRLQRANQSCQRQRVSLASDWAIVCLSCGGTRPKNTHSFLPRIRGFKCNCSKKACQSLRYDRYAESQSIQGAVTTRCLRLLPSCIVVLVQTSGLPGCLFLEVSAHPAMLASRCCPSCMLLRPSWTQIRHTTVFAA